VVLNKYLLVPKYIMSMHIQLLHAQHNNFTNSFIITLFMQQRRPYLRQKHNQALYDKTFAPNKKLWCTLTPDSHSMSPLSIGNCIDHVQITFPNVQEDKSCYDAEACSQRLTWQQ